MACGTESNKLPSIALTPPGFGSRWIVTEGLGVIAGRGAASLAAALVMAWPFGAAQAGALDGLTGYAELRFGLPLGEAAALTGAAPSAAEDGSDLIESQETMAGRPALRQLWFRDGKLSRIVFRWTVEDAADAARCQALFGQLAGLVAGRYAKPTLGPTEIEAGKSFTGGAFWVFDDGANIGLSAAYAPSGAQGCRAMLSYREPPPD